MSKEIILNKEQVAILDHTLKNGVYCGNSKDMAYLCERGLMQFTGIKTFVPDAYYRITREGKNVRRN